MIIDFLLAFCDVEGNFLVVKVRLKVKSLEDHGINSALLVQAYQYTDLLSAMLLDAYALRLSR